MACKFYLDFYYFIFYVYYYYLWLSKSIASPRFQSKFQVITYKDLFCRHTMQIFFPDAFQSNST